MDLRDERQPSLTYLSAGCSNALHVTVLAFKTPVSWLLPQACPRLAAENPHPRQPEYLDCHGC